MSFLRVPGMRWPPQADGVLMPLLGELWKHEVRNNPQESFCTVIKFLILTLTFSDNIPETYNRENPVIGLRYMNRYPLRIFVKRSEYCFAF